MIGGYATIMHEIDEQLGALGAPQPDLMLVQNGVGALAAAVGAHYGGRGTDRPLLAAVEPDDAACMLESLAAGRIVTVPGPHRSIMAGLNCGTLSMVAWPVLQAHLRALHHRRRRPRPACDAPPGGRRYRVGRERRVGPRGAPRAPRGSRVRGPASPFSIGPDTNVLVFSTEGATDPEAYAAVVGHPPADRAWRRG